VCRCSGGLQTKLNFHSADCGPHSRSDASFESRNGPICLVHIPPCISIREAVLHRFANLERFVKGRPEQAPTGRRFLLGDAQSQDLHLQKFVGSWNQPLAVPFRIRRCPPTISLARSFFPISTYFITVCNCVSRLTKGPISDFWIKAVANFLRALTLSLSAQTVEEFSIYTFL